MIKHSVSNDNPYSKSIFKTCKYCPQYPTKGFVSLKASRKWCLEFVHWYRHEHHHSGIKFLTPNQVHTGKAERILEARRKVYELAREKAAQRWSGKTRDWTLPEKVWLNPVKIS